MRLPHRVSACGSRQHAVTISSILIPARIAAYAGVLIAQLSPAKHRSVGGGVFTLVGARLEGMVCRTRFGDRRGVGVQDMCDAGCRPHERGSQNNPEAWIEIQARGGLTMDLCLLMIALS